MRSTAEAARLGIAEISTVKLELADLMSGLFSDLFFSTLLLWTRQPLPLSLPTAIFSPPSAPLQTQLFTILSKM